MEVKVFLVVVTIIVLLPMPEAMREPKVHVVGGGLGWTAPPDCLGLPDFYQNWARGHMFYIQDSLDFYNRNGNTDLAEVNEEAFKYCSISNAYNVWHERHVYKFTKIGNHYFISTNRDHCIGGQKLNVTVFFQSVRGPKF